MEWSGRAPAPPRRDAGRGWQSKEHSHVQQIQSDHCHDGYRYWQEFIPRRRPRSTWRDRAAAEVVTWPEVRLANMAACLIGMEACVGAHHLSRKLQAYGHDARLMPAKYVRAYSKGS